MPEEIDTPKLGRPFSNKAKQKNQNAQALGKLGGRKGGLKTQSMFTPEQRQERSRKASDTRWGKHKGKKVGVIKGAIRLLNNGIDKKMSELKVLQDARNALMEIKWLPPPVGEWPGERDRDLVALFWAFQDNGGDSEIKMNKEQLKEVLELHKDWVFSESDGKKADLRSADLRSANLRSANLRSADLRSADLRSADLRSANLHSADLRYANLHSADLSSANFIYTKLDQIKINVPEEKARERLKTLISPEEYQRYINFGICFIEGAMFGLMELTQTPTGWFCLDIQSPDPLPVTDRVIHRILLWRKGQGEFYKIAKQQI